MTQQAEKEEISHWRSGSIGPSPDTTSNLGFGSHHPACCLTMTPTTVTIPTLLTVSKVFAITDTQCVHHLPDPPCLPYLLRFPPHPAFSKHIQSTTNFLYITSLPYAISPIPAMSTLNNVSTSVIVRGPACTAIRSYCTYHIYFACSVAHLHRKHPCWLCRQRACVC